MEIWPAIDLRRGKCVRLKQGDYHRETVFGEDPAAMARHWVELGAERFHLVDLDGAREGRPANLQSVRAILEAVNVPCELGGGIRSQETIGELLDLGLARLVIGTQAIRQPDWFRRMARRFPGKLVLGIDARDGRVATDGWEKTTDVKATELARQFAGEPIAAIIYTDIATDGMLTGPNVEATRQMAEHCNVPIIASGGMSTLADVEQLATLELFGIIIGRAYYEGTIDLREALRVVGSK